MTEDCTNRESLHCNGSRNIQATVIDESNHPIRRHDIDREALKVLYRLRDAGFSGYLVGGGVRDLYLGKKPKDFDISTNARPGQLRKLFRNSRTIGRRFRLVQVFFKGGKIIEVSTLRSQSEFDIKKQTAILPSNNTFGSLDEDAFRRDLTINSLFYEVQNNSIIDYVGGVDDLDSGIVRIVGHPDTRCTRDPVRILRAIRHCARNGFSIEPETWKAIKKNCHKLEVCPPSRIRDEILKDLKSGNSCPWVELLLKSEVFTTLFPFYKNLLQGEVEGRAEEKLLKLFSVVDRLYSDSSPASQLVIPDDILLGIIFIPWASERFQLTSKRFTGPQYHNLAKKIRTEIDQVLGERLNLKRATKQAITTLLINLSTFHTHSKKETWPAWLQKKSYFKDCSRFYEIYSEAYEDGRVGDSLFIQEPSAQEQQGYILKGKRSNNKNRRQIMPAFTSTDNGVFGLKGK